MTWTSRKTDQIYVRFTYRWRPRVRVQIGPLRGPLDGYRVTVNGPGVTPIIAWEAEAPANYDPQLDRVANDQIAAFGDPQCRPI